MNAFHFSQKNYNIYISCAKYEKIPIFTFDLTQRSQFTGQWFDTQSFKDAYDYDIFLDFDAKEDNYTAVHYQVTKLIYMLNKYKIPYCLQNSGRFGIHVIMPGFLMWKDNDDLDYVSNDPEDTGSLNERIKRFVSSMQERFNLMIDPKGLGVHNKLFKCPYSLVGDIVVLPQSFHLNEIERYDTYVAYAKTNLKGRGFHYANNTNETGDILKQRFKRFVNDNLLVIE